MTKRTGYLRMRKDNNGCSLCYAKPENVGKRKCVHQLSNLDITVEKDGQTNLVNIDANFDGDEHRFSLKATTKEVMGYIQNISKGLTKQEKESLIEKLRLEH